MKLEKCIKAAALGLSLFCLSEANAQIFKNERFKLGIKGGYSLSSIAETSKTNVWNDGKDHRNAFYAGLVSEYSLTREKGASIQLEVLYSQQGDKIKENYAGVKETATIELDYISVPVLAKIYIIDRVALYGGPTVAFNVNEKAVFKAGDVKITEKIDVEKVDVLATAGIEISLAKGLYLEGRYNHGLKSIERRAGNNFNNSNIQIGVGYKF